MAGGRDLRLAPPDLLDLAWAYPGQHEAVALVVGLPRGLDGQETAQTQTVRDFAAQLREHVAVPMFWQDEALTSQKAEDELSLRKKPFAKGDVDALAATYILDDFLQDNSDLQRLPPSSIEHKAAQPQPRELGHRAVERGL